MHGLIGERFLKRFFGTLLRRRVTNPGSQAETVLENQAEKAAEPCCPAGQNPLDQEALVDPEEADENRDLHAPQDEAEQPAGGERPLAPDE